MNIEAQNKEFCRIKAPGLYEHLYERPPLYPDLCIERTPRGIKVCLHDMEAYLSSIYSREAEFAGLFAQVSPETEIIIWGGEVSEDLLRYLQKNFKSLQQLIVVDPTSQIMQVAFMRESLEGYIKILKNKKIVIFANLTEADMLPCVFGEVGLNHKTAIVFSVVFQSLFEEFCQNFRRKIVESMKVNLMNLVTNNAFYNTWMINSLKNYREPVVLGEAIAPFIAGKSVIVVSAGPSLKKNVNLLKQADKKAVIIAVGSSVPILNQLGIRPHFNVGLDLGQGVGFSNLAYTDVPLLFGPKIQPETLEIYPGTRICFVSAADFLEMYLFMNEDNEEFIPDTGLSVAVSLASLVCKMGAKKVIFIGQDMCMYDNQLHAIEQESDAEVATFDKMHLEDIYGNKVQSIQGYWGIKLYLEKMIKKHPEVMFLNATEGGLGLNGADNVLLSQVLEELPELRNSLKQEIEDVLAGAKKINLMEEVEKKEVLKDTRDIVKRCKIILNSVEKIGKMQKNGAQNKKVLHELSSIQKQRAKIEAVPFYEVIQKVFKGMFASVDIQYSNELRSKNAEQKLLAQIKITVGVIVPIKEYCELLEHEYIKLRLEREQKFRDTEKG